MTNSGDILTIKYLVNYLSVSYIYFPTSSAHRSMTYSHPIHDYLIYQRPHILLHSYISGMTGETEEGVSRERSHADCFFCACMHVAERSKCGEGTRRNAEKSRKGPAEVTHKEEKKLPL